MSTQSPDPLDEGQKLHDIRRQMDIATLTRHCAAENEHFHHGRSSDPSYAYELFRRALHDRDEAAWEALYNHYHALVEHWVRSNAAFQGSNERSDVLACEAFARFWHAIPPARFAQFPSVNALLQYLQLCAGCVVIDSVRTAARQWSTELLPLSDIQHRAPDEEVIERMRHEELWRHVVGQLNGEAERVVVFDSFVGGLKPRDICARRRDLFASVKEVYTVKHNVLARLSRDQGLRKLLG